MSFARFSSDFLMNNFTLVDNLFISELLPNLEANEIKVYLYGQYLCMNQTKDNSLEAMAKTLSVSPKTILQTFKFFEDNGLVHVISEEPLEVEYLCLKNHNQLPKKYKADKYTDFSKHLQALFPSRMLTPNEYNEYFQFLEKSGMSQDALIMIVQYCIDIKDENVKYPYILAIARDWSSEGIKTIEDVETKLDSFETQSELMRKVLVALHRKGSADLEEKQMLTNWTKILGFGDNAIIYAAKSSKSKTFKNLDTKLNEFYRLSIFTEEQMKDYNKHHEFLSNLAIEINRKIGVYYQTLDNEIETYIVPWTNKGYTQDALLVLANYCFIIGIKTLEGLNNIIHFLYPKGIITTDAINEFISSQVKESEQIKNILNTIGTLRNVTSQDKNYYHTWIEDWNCSNELIMYAANEAKGQTYPMSFINNLLSKWKSNNINTIEEAEAFQNNTKKTSNKATPIITREYTPEELKEAFGDNNISDSDI